MATLNTNIATKQASGLLKDRVVNSQATSGELRRVHAVYTTTGAEADADLIAIADLPIGAVLLPDLCRVSSEAIGGTGSAVSKLGDAGDDDRYSATSIALTSAATTAVTPTAAIGLTPFAITAGNETIKATFALTSGSVTAAKTVSFRLVYLLP